MSNTTTSPVQAAKDALEALYVEEHAAIVAAREPFNERFNEARKALEDAVTAEVLAANGEAFQAIADAVGGDAEKVATFLAEVSRRSTFSVNYLISVINGG